MFIEPRGQLSLPLIRREVAYHLALGDLNAQLLQMRLRAHQRHHRQIDTALALPDIYTRNPKQAAQLSQARANAATALAKAEEDWLEASALVDQAAG